MKSLSSSLFVHGSFTQLFLFEQKTGEPVFPVLGASGKLLKLTKDAPPEVTQSQQPQPPPIISAPQPSFPVPVMEEPSPMAVEVQILKSPATPVVVPSKAMAPKGDTRPQEENYNIAHYSEE